MDGTYMLAYDRGDVGDVILDQLLQPLGRETLVGYIVRDLFVLGRGLRVVVLARARSTR